MTPTTKTSHEPGFCDAPPTLASGPSGASGISARPSLSGLAPSRNPSRAVANIRAGYENGLAEMSVVEEVEVCVHIGVTVPKLTIGVRTEVRTSTQMTVKYK